RRPARPAPQSLPAMPARAPRPSWLLPAPPRSPLTHARHRTPPPGHREHKQRQRLWDAGTRPPPHPAEPARYSTPKRRGRHRPPGLVARRLLSYHRTFGLALEGYTMSQARDKRQTATREAARDRRQTATRGDAATEKRET